MRVLFFTNANTSRIVAQDLNAKDLIAHFDESFEVFVFNKGPGEVDPKCLKPNVHIINIQTLGQKIAALYVIFIMRMDYHFYIRSYQSIVYWWVKRLVGNRARTIHPVEIVLPYPDNDAYQRRARRNALRSDYIFGLTDRIIESVEREYGVRPIGKIPIGVDREVFTTLPKASRRERLRVISAGSLQARKRPEFFVEIAKRCPMVDFVWIGGGELHDAVMTKASDENVINFKLLPSMPQRALAKEMAISDIFFFPSLHEGLPKVAVEAMACGLPAIVYDAYGPEHVEDGLSGFVVGDDEMAQRRLLELINDAELRARLAAGAVARAERYDWKNVAAQWKDFLLRALDREP